MIIILEETESVFDFDLLPATGRDHSGSVMIWASPEAYAQEQVLKRLREQVLALSAVSGVIGYVRLADVEALLDGCEQ